jgi:hypothetical protein
LTSGMEYAPAWSPDGRRIAFSFESDVSSVSIVSLAAGRDELGFDEPPPLTGDPCEISPDCDVAAVMVA